MNVLNLIILMSVLRCLCWNMRGAMYGTSYFQALLNKSDCCFLTEHWLNETNIIFKKKFANEFEVVYNISSNCNNTMKGSGGTAILVRKSLGCRIVNLQLNNDRICGLKLSLEGYQEMCLICTLLPSTNYSQDTYFNYLDILTCYYDTICEDCITIIGGDFNVDITKTNNPCSKTKTLTGFLKTRNLLTAPLLNGRIGTNYTFRNREKSQRILLHYVCIPEFLANNTSYLEVKSNCPYEVSDHYPIMITLNIDLLCGSSDKIKIGRNVLKWTKADDIEIKMYQTEVDKLMNFEIKDTEKCNQNDIEQYTNILTNVLHIAANSSIPIMKFRPYLKPYWKENNLKNLHFQQRNARRIWKLNNKPRNKNDPAYKNHKDQNVNFVKGSVKQKVYGKKKNMRI